MDAAQPNHDNGQASQTFSADTNVFLEYLYEQRGSKVEAITSQLDYIGFDRLVVSVVTLAEVYRRTKQDEVRVTKDLIGKFSVAPLTKPVSDLFQETVFEYKNYHPSVADALIAVTAIEYNAQLFTFNRKHFAFYRGLTLYNPTYTL